MSSSIFAFVLVFGSIIAERTVLSQVPPGPKGPCHLKHEEIQQMIKNGLADVITPACTEEGFFKVVQVGGFAGNGHLCVNPRDGKEVDGSFRETVNGFPRCGPCFKQIEGLLTRQPVAGRYVAACDDQGYYQIKQLDTSTGFGYCANKMTGEKTSPPQRGEIICGKPLQPQAQGTFGPCHEERNRVQGAAGAVLPECTGEGYWRSVQTVNGGQQCVNPANGKPLAGTFANGQVTCGACHKKLENLLSRRPMPGRFIPACDDQGWFQEKQTDALLGLSFCVSKTTGARKSKPQREPLDCDAISSREVQKQKSRDIKIVN